MRLGVFGGTFDPPHLGHLILAAEACDQLGLERVLWVLTPNPPHKYWWAITPATVRVDMVLAAIGDNPCFELSRVDLDRPLPHYALETVKLLADTHPEAELVYLMGGDSLRDLPTWHKPAEFVAACQGLGVFRRPYQRPLLKNLEKRLPGVTAKVTWINAPLIDIASHEIRRKVAAGQPYRYYVPDPVFCYIEQNRLYQ